MMRAIWNATSWFWLLASRLSLGALFGLAAWTKFQNPQAFLDGLKAYRVLPDHLMLVAAYAFPWLEAIVAVLLVIGLWARAAALVTVIMLVSFIGAIVSVMARADVVVTECSCFGDFIKFCQGPPGWCHIGLDLVLLAMATLVLAAGPGLISADRAVRAASVRREGRLDAP